MHQGKLSEGEREHTHVLPLLPSTASTLLDMCWEDRSLGAHQLEMLSSSSVLHDNRQQIDQLPPMLSSWLEDPLPQAISCL